MMKHVHVLTSRVENSVDPDQLASLKPADLDLHCFQKSPACLCNKYSDL